MTRRATSEEVPAPFYPPAPAPAPTPDPGTDTSSTASRTPKLRLRRLRPRLRPRPRTTSTSSTASTSSTTPTPTPRRNAAPNPNPITESFTFLGNTLLSLLLFTRDTLTSLLSLLRTPLKVLLCLYLIFALGVSIYQALSAPLLRAVQPLCALPGVALFDLPLCAGGSSGRPTKTTPHKTDFKGLVDLQANFGEILEKSATEWGLAYDLKRSEFAISDLNVLVRASELGCRDELSARLDDFLRAAKSTSSDLSRFGSSVNGVVDSIISIDNYALRTLDGARSLQLASSAQNPLVALALAPFRRLSPLARAEASVHATFVAAGNAMDTNIQALILRARTVLDDLEILDEMLKTINGVVMREDSDQQQQQQAHQDVLWRILEALGVFPGVSARYEANLQLLQGMKTCRNHAAKHVRASLVRLEKMSGDLEDLRTRVAAPGVLADMGVGELPLEVHMETIRRGVNRLAESMDRARGVRGRRRDEIIGAYRESTIGLE